MEKVEHGVSNFSDIIGDIAEAGQAQERARNEVSDQVERASAESARMRRDITAVRDDAGVAAGVSDKVKAAAGDLSRLGSELSEAVSGYLHRMSNR